MDNIKLAISEVRFDEGKHEYWLGDQQLQGITGMLHNQLFPSQYDGIPQRILDEAAEWGSRIHGECELYDSIGAEPTEQQAIDYVNLCKENNLECIASEYIVTNNISHASAIDKVFKGTTEGGVIIADIKTTSKLYEDYVSWQDSIYRDFFEMMNPSLHVEKCLAIWLPKPNYGKAKIIEVEMIDKEEIEMLIMAEQSGVQFHPAKPIVLDKSEMPAKYVDIEAALYEKLNLIKQLEEEAKKFKTQLGEAMRAAGVTSWKSERLTISSTKDTEVTTFDSKKFKEDYPELYEQYLKKSAKKGSITIRLK